MKRYRGNIYPQGEHNTKDVCLVKHLSQGIYVRGNTYPKAYVFGGTYIPGKHISLQHQCSILRTITLAYGTEQDFRRHLAIMVPANHIYNSLLHACNMCTRACKCMNEQGYRAYQRGSTRTPTRIIIYGGSSAAGNGQVVPLLDKPCALMKSALT